MKRIAASLLCMLLIATSSAGCRDSVPPEPQRPPPTAAEILSDVQKERAAGRPDSALRLARHLISEHGDAPEAETARRQIPDLEAVITDLAEAQRIRAAEAAAAAETRRLAEKWTYSVSEDPMTSRKSKSATIESENTVNFDFPYQGSQRATLVIRDHPTYGRDVILSIERGQLMCQSYRDCQIRVRFDEGKAETWNAAGPADNSSTAVFFRNQARFFQKLRAAKVLRLQVAVYQEGEPIFEFHVGGFDDARFRGTP